MGPCCAKLNVNKSKASRGQSKRWEEKRGGKKAGGCLLLPIGLSVLHSPFLSVVDFVKCWSEENF